MPKDNKPSGWARSKAKAAAAGVSGIRATAPELQSLAIRAKNAHLTSVADQLNLYADVIENRYGLYTGMLQGATWKGKLSEINQWIDMARASIAYWEANP